MKKVLLILACGIATQLSYAQATPKWADKAKKAVFSIVTYDKDNKIKNTGNSLLSALMITARSAPSNRV